MRSGPVWSKSVQLQICRGRSGYDMVKPGQLNVRSVQVSSVQVSSDQVKSGQVRSRSGQIWSDVGKSQVRSSHVWS